MAGFYAFIDAKMVNSAVFGGRPLGVLLKPAIGLIWVDNGPKQGSERRA
jgi:hypothetical protein